MAKKKLKSILDENSNNTLTEAPIGVDSSEYVSLDNVSNIHIDSETGNFVGIRTQQGERPEYVVGNVDDVEDADLSIRTADKVSDDKELIDNAERRKDLAKKVLNRADKIVKNGSELTHKDAKESLEEDCDNGQQEVFDQAVEQSEKSKKEMDKVMKERSKDAIQKEFTLKKTNNMGLVEEFLTSEGFELNENTYSKDFADRKEMGKVISKLKENNANFTISRSAKDGMRYTLKSLKESRKLNEEIDEKVEQCANEVADRLAALGTDYVDFGTYTDILYDVFLELEPFENDNDWEESGKDIDEWNSKYADFETDVRTLLNYLGWETNYTTGDLMVNVDVESGSVYVKDNYNGTKEYYEIIDVDPESWEVSYKHTIKDEGTEDMEAFRGMIAGFELTDSVEESLKESFTEEEQEIYNIDKDGNEIGGKDHYVHCSCCKEAFPESSCEKNDKGYVCPNCKGESLKEEKVETNDVSDRIEIKRDEYLSKKDELKKNGYRLIGSGDGKMIFAKPKKIDEAKEDKYHNKVLYDIYDKLDKAGIRFAVDNNDFEFDTNKDFQKGCNIIDKALKNTEHTYSTHGWNVKVELTGFDESLDEASSSFKKSVKNGGQDTQDYLDGKAIGKVTDKDERDRLVATKKLEKSGKLGNRPTVAQELKRKEDQVAPNYEKKAIKYAMKKGMTEGFNKDDYDVVKEFGHASVCVNKNDKNDVRIHLGGSWYVKPEIAEITTGYYEKRGVKEGDLYYKDYKETKDAIEYAKQLQSKKESIKEELKLISTIDEYKPWSGAVDFYNEIVDADKLGELEFILEDVYPDGLTITQLNDLLWFEQDWVREMLGMTENVSDDDTDDIDERFLK